MDFWGALAKVCGMRPGFRGCGEQWRGHLIDFGALWPRSAVCGLVFGVVGERDWGPLSWDVRYQRHPKKPFRQRTACPLLS